MRYNAFIGIDVGKSGAVSIISDEGVDVFKMPDHLDIRKFVDIIKEKTVGLSPFAMIEKVQSRPTDSAHSSFVFGRYVQMAYDTLSVVGIPYDEVRPQVWQKIFGVPRKMEYNDRKRWLKVKAGNIFPNIKPTLWSADALLISEYCYRKFNTKNDIKM